MCIYDMYIHVANMLYHSRRITLCTVHHLIVPEHHVIYQQLRRSLGVRLCPWPRKGFSLDTETALACGLCRGSNSSYTRSPLEDSRLFGPSPWKILRHYLWTNIFLSNPAPGENLLSGNLVLETALACGLCNRFRVWWFRESEGFRA